MRLTATSPGSPTRHRRARVVDDRDAVARVGPAHRARFRRPQRVRVADDVVHLGLAEHLVDRRAERLLRPREHRGAHRLAGAHDAAQPHVEVLARPRIRLHHELERGREQERVADLVFLHQPERALGVEAAAVADDRLAEVQRGQQRVHEPAGPRPVGRRPEEIAVLRIAVVRVHEARQVADEASVRHQRALRRTRGAARVHDERRIVGARGDGREVRRRRRDRGRRSRRGRRRARPRRRARASGAAAARGSARDCPSTADRRSRRPLRSSRSGTRARRDRTGTTAARPPRPSGRRRCARRRVSRRCGRISATLSPRPTPRPASTLDSRFASRCRSQNECAEAAPDSSSQYSAKRARSPAQRPQHACAMLNSAGTVQRWPAWISAYRSTVMVSPVEFAGPPQGTRPRWGSGAQRRSGVMLLVRGGGGNRLRQHGRHRRR